MDFTQPLTILLQQGTGYVLFVLACGVILWMARAREKDRAELITSYEHRLQDAQVLAKTANDSINQFTQSLRDNNHQSEQILSASNAIANGVQQLVFRKEVA